MNRRSFLRAGACVTVGSTLAGCTSDTAESTEKDSDGDGVPDEHDYAPQDPDVQVKADIEKAGATPTEETRHISNTATPTSTPTPTPVPTQTPTPIPSPTPTPTDRSANEIEVDTRPFENQTHHFVRYSFSEIEVQIYSSLLDNAYPDGAQVVYALMEYPSPADPNSRMLETYRSDVIPNPTQSDTRLTTTIDVGTSPSSPFYFTALLIPAGAELSELGSGDGETLAQTDRLAFASGSLVQSPLDIEPDSIETASYDRVNANGAYILHFYGQTYGTSWTASMVAYKSFYATSSFRDRYNDFTRYVSEAITDGYANTLATILRETASDRGITDPRLQLEMVIDFVQNLPYVSDDVSSGFDEYPKSMVETLIEAGGDCEDSAIMLAAMIRSEAFGYGAALLFPPGHAAVGVKGGDDVSGSYYEHEGVKYFYIETTGENWEVGEIPDEYQNERAQVYPV